MLVGTVVENSLSDPSLLSSFRILNTWKEGDWTLHSISLSEEQAQVIGSQLVPGPWYVHFWNPDTDAMLVIFRGHTFHCSRTDESSWDDARAFGKSIHIPEEQLDFITS
jgi:hypothetical protein